MHIGLTLGINSALLPNTVPVSSAPVLSDPVDEASGPNGATGSVSTNQDGGTLYWVASTSATAPSAEQVADGQMHTGASAAASGSQAVTATGAQPLSPAPSGLTAATTYYLHFTHESPAGISAVASGDGFTTLATSTAGQPIGLLLTLTKAA